MHDAFGMPHAMRRGFFPIAMFFKKGRMEVNDKGMRSVTESGCFHPVVIRFS